MELLAPAGSFETARAAFAAGADAVYLGLCSFSARADATNFTFDELQSLLAYARSDKVHPRYVYVTFNTVIDEANFNDAIEYLVTLDSLAPDGVIVQDLGVARVVREYCPHLQLHASTQLVAHNLEGVLALKELGFTRVVLARELSLEEIRSITKRCGIEIEVFVHGALCYSLSGLCLFSAMEKNRSGNRGKCAYCCRLGYTDAVGVKSLPFSMRDLRWDDCLESLRDSGVTSLKIEGRMKSALYVSTVTAHYRALLDGTKETVSRADLETVFSRRTTHLYAQGAVTADQVIDATSLGHLGTPIGTVKRITKDREGRSWLRFHTSRALERHDGLQFLSPGSKPYGFGINEMRVALARSILFNVPAGSDVEVLVPDEAPIHSGDTVYLSASNEVKRRFPIPAFRPNAYQIGKCVAFKVVLNLDRLVITAKADILAEAVVLESSGPFSVAQHSERTASAWQQALGSLGDTAWCATQVEVEDMAKVFVPVSQMKEFRREIVEKLDAAYLAQRSALVAQIQNHDWQCPNGTETSVTRVVKIRLDQPLPNNVCDFDEVVVAMGHVNGKEVSARLVEFANQIRDLADANGDPVPLLRLALPVWTHERDFNALRTAVKHLVAAGIMAWEVADLATLRLVRALGLADITADWTLYAFNRVALAQLAELGVTRVVASPENSLENLQALAECGGISVEFLREQNTPLFISLTKPVTEDPSLLTGVKGDTFRSFEVDGLWITTRTEPRHFDLPSGCNQIERVDLSFN